MSPHGGATDLRAARKTTPCSFLARWGLTQAGKASRGQPPQPRCINNTTYGTAGPATNIHSTLWSGAPLVRLGVINTEILLLR